MNSLGQYLKHGREEVGVSLEELAQRTKIRLESLQSLEKDDLESLPTDPYVRGFVKLVCRELGLTPQEGLARYESLRAHAGPSDEMTWAEERSLGSKGRLGRALEDPEQVVRRARRVARIAAWSVAGLAVAGLVWGGARLVGKWTSDDPQIAAADRPGEAAEPEAPAALPLSDVDLGSTAAAQRTSPPEPTLTAGDPEPTKETALAETPSSPDRQDPAPALADTSPAEAAVPQVALDLPFEEVLLERAAPVTIPAGSILVTVKPIPTTAEREAAEAAEQARLDQLADEAAEQTRLDDLAAAETERARLDQEAADAAERDRVNRLAAEAAERKRLDRAAAEAAEQARLDRISATASEQARPEPTATEARAADAEPAPADPVPAATPARPIAVSPPAAGDRLVLEVEALRAVTITVLLDGVGYPRSGSLRAGDRKAWKADSLFLLSADDAGALSIRVSGNDLGVPGVSGQPLDRLPLRVRR